MVIYVSDHPEVQKIVVSLQGAVVTLANIRRVQETGRGKKEGRREISQVQISKHFIEFKILI
jgi:hypothetical protein